MLLRGSVWWAGQPPVLTFEAPTFQIGSSTTNTHTAATTAGSVSGTVGQRLVVLAGHARGSIGSPSSGVRTLSDITGSDDFSGLSLSDFTSHEDIASQISGDVAGVRLIARSYVLAGSMTGTITVTWSNTCWAQFVQACVLPACSLVDSDDGTANGTEASVDIDYVEALNADDLMVSLGAQLLTNDVTIPTGHTTTDTVNNANARFRGSYKVGTPADPTTWSGLYTSSGLPKAAIGTVWRRT